MITSRKNPRIQQIRTLLSKKNERQSSGQCVLEGTRLLEEACQADWQPLFGFFTQPLTQRNQTLLQMLQSAGAALEEVPADLLSYMADTANPQGLVVVFQQRALAVPENPTFVLVLDAIRDPGNLGTILRSAAAAGVDLILLSEDCVDPYSPKVMRSAMGAHFHLPLQRLPLTEIIHTCQQQHLQLFVADSNAGTSCWQQEYRSPTALVIGNEANGPSPLFHDHPVSYTKIPMPGGFESLNAAVAAGILLFEVTRQRTS